MVLVSGESLGTVVVERRLESRHGELYVGRQPGLGRRVALRVLPRDGGADFSRLERFRREARLAARVRHPNVVGVHDGFVTPDREVTVLEHFDGGDLERALSVRGSPPASVSAAIALGAARGLSALHAAGVVLAGLRPRKVLLSRMGDVALSGLAEARELGEERPGISPPATPYSAPELDAGVADARADVFSLATLIRALTSRRARLPARLRRATTRALALDRAERPELGELIEALERAHPASPEAVAEWLLGPGAGKKEPAAEPALRLLRVTSAALGVAVLGALAAAGWGLFQGSEPPPELPPVAAAPARVSVHAVPWAEVQVDGAEPFFTPRAEPLALVPGDHTVVFRHPTLGEARRAITVAAGERLRLRHAFNGGPDR